MESDEKSGTRPWADMLSGAVAPPARPHPKRAGFADEHWAVGGKRFMLDGQAVTLYPIRAMALALGRSNRTLHRWESQGVLPHCQYWVDSVDPRGRRRLYTGDLIDGLLKIAAQEGVLDRKVASFERSGFPERAHALDRRLRRRDTTP